MSDKPKLTRRGASSAAPQAGQHAVAEPALQGHDARPGSPARSCGHGSRSNPGEGAVSIP